MVYSLLNRVALACASAGLAIASVLTVAHASNMPLPCGSSAGCDRVAQDPSSYYMGIPVSAFGIGAYLVLILASVMRIYGISIRKWSFVGLVVSFMGVVVSALLTYYSITKIHATCAWCLGSGAMMVISTIAYIGTPNASKGIRDEGNPKNVIVWVAMPTALVAVFAVIGGIARPKPPDLSSVNFKSASLAQLEASSRPMGKTACPINIVEFADLMCPACRQMHLRLVLFMSKNKGRVRLLYHPFPLVNIEGHELSQYAAELSEQLNDDDFWAFVGKVYGAEQQPGRAELDKMFMSLRGKRKRTPEEAHAYVLDDMKLGASYGVKFTPTYILFLDGKPVDVASSADLQQVIRRKTYARIFQSAPTKGN